MVENGTPGQKICAQSDLTITVRDQNMDDQSEKHVELPVYSSLGKAKK